LSKIIKKEIAELTKVAEFVGCEIKKGAEFIGHGIKEDTELAEHEAGIHDVKNDAISVFNKMKTQYSDATN
jgi:hypothetical protein